MVSSILSVPDGTQGGKEKKKKFNAKLPDKRKLVAASELHGEFQPQI
jgi:hypothetical protein